MARPGRPVAARRLAGHRGGLVVQAFRLGQGLRHRGRRGHHRLGLRQLGLDRGDPHHRPGQRGLAGTGPAPGLDPAWPGQAARPLRRHPRGNLGTVARAMAHAPYLRLSRTMTSQPIPARMRGLNRAEICDVNFSEFVRNWSGEVDAPPAPDEAILEGSALDATGFRELFESQLISRHLDLMARVLRVQDKVYYTIGSSGHEGNAMVARALRHTDPAFLHYRSGGFMAERFRKLPGMDPIMDSALSFAASKEDPISGGRHKVWGSKPLWVLPQTSTIASHLPKALGTAMA